MRQRALATERPDAPCTPGVWCEETYCPGAVLNRCPAYTKFNLDLIVSDFDDMDESIRHDLPMRTPKVSMLTPERRSFIIRHRPMITRFLDRLHDAAMDDALKGRPTPGLKAVLGRSPPRKWTDAAEAEARLTHVLPESKMFTRKIVSPTQVEKLLSERRYAGLSDIIDRGEKKPVLVDEHDARPAVATVADEFDD